MSAAHPLLALVDCPDCRRDEGLVPQGEGGRAYLACPTCRFWYPIVDEVVVLLAPARNPEGRRRPLDPPAPLDLPRHRPAFADLKVCAYGFCARLEEFGAAFGLDSEPLVVDVGCSTGALAAWLRPDQQYVGVDLSFASLRFARRGTGQWVVQADATRLPFKTGAVPFFAAREVIEHLGDPLAGLRELARAGRRGVVVVPTLDFPFLYDPVNWVLGRRGRRLRFGVHGYGHEHVHSIARWRALVEQAGLAVERERPVGTGLALNASDLLWHALFSWRDFDRLPRRGIPMAAARLARRLGRAVHRLDAPLLGRASSQAFAVTAPRIC